MKKCKSRGVDDSAFGDSIDFALSGIYVSDVFCYDGEFGIKHGYGLEFETTDAVKVIDSHFNGFVFDDPFSDIAVKDGVRKTEDVLIGFAGEAIGRGFD